MDYVRIRGGRALCGEISVSGSKNACLPILAACLLTKDECVIENVPHLSDTRLMLKILQLVGAHVQYQSKHTVSIRAESVDPHAPYELVKQMRASVCLMGAFLGRTQTSDVSIPGGCVIGQRPIDLHIKGFNKLGCKIEIKNGNLCIDGRDMHGERIFLGGRNGSTVTGTANILMAALGAKGTTTIECAAYEPEIIDLCHFLQKLGAVITGVGTSTLTIEGGHELHGCRYRIIGDRMEAGTFICAGLMTRGKLKILNNTPNINSVVYDKLNDIGANVYEDADGTIFVDGSNCELRSSEVVTMPYPGFPTDLQAQFCALLTQANGISIVTERVYPSRFMHVPELNRMGAGIMIEGEHAIIHGVTSQRLIGAQLMASDLRASAALFLAGLCAEGETIVSRVYHLDRGYERFDEKLRSLGADITRESA
ncbi:MAG: UDP-N-acetylglucosamine 1-carboxyvinyltransferase [Opitutales bacterium]|nr:UDP-N-acetylglucosamine 1-carboxyvinyltransferase [Opitutales bacterium]